MTAREAVIWALLLTGMALLVAALGVVVRLLTPAPATDYNLRWDIPAAVAMPDGYRVWVDDQLTVDVAVAAIRQPTGCNCMEVPVPMEPGTHKVTVRAYYTPPAGYAGPAEDLLSEPTGVMVTVIERVRR